MAQSKIEAGCYGDGALGHQHTRERCADTLEGAINRFSTASGEAQASQRDIVNALRGEMSDDGQEEYDACDLLNLLCPLAGHVWEWRDGDFGLWTDESDEGEDATAKTAITLHYGLFSEDVPADSIVRARTLMGVECTELDATYDDEGANYRADELLAEIVRLPVSARQTTWIQIRNESDDVWTTIDPVATRAANETAIEAIEAEHV